MSDRQTVNDLLAASRARIERLEPRAVLVGRLPPDGTRRCSVHERLADPRPYCVMALQGVDLMRAHGLSARRLEDGLPEWRIAGYPVAVGLD